METEIAVLFNGFEALNGMNINKLFYDLLINTKHEIYYKILLILKNRENPMRKFFNILINRISNSNNSEKIFINCIALKYN